MSSFVSALNRFPERADFVQAIVSKYGLMQNQVDFPEPALSSLKASIENYLNDGDPIDKWNKRLHACTGYAGIMQPMSCEEVEKFKSICREAALSFLHTFRLHEQIMKPLQHLRPSEPVWLEANLYANTNKTLLTKELTGKLMGLGLTARSALSLTGGVIRLCVGLYSNDTYRHVEPEHPEPFTDEDDARIHLRNIDQTAGSNLRRLEAYSRQTTEPIRLA